MLGFSAWWLVLVAARVWLGGLARLLRAEVPPEAPHDPHARPRWLFWLGLALLLAASCALELTRLYQFEPTAAAAMPAASSATCSGRPACGCSASPARACCGSPRWWSGLALAFEFSWLQLAETIGARLESLRERRRVERIERAEDIRLGEQALREREQVVEVEQRSRHRGPRPDR